MNIKALFSILLLVSSASAADSLVETNEFEKLDGCYDMLSGRLDGVLYSVEIKSEPDSCSGSSVGKTSFIVTTSKNGRQTKSTWFDMHILKSGGQFTLAEDKVAYKYQGPDHYGCNLKDNMILVESLSFDSRQDEAFDVRWFGMHCDLTMSYKKCESLALIWKWQLRKSADCNPK